MNDLHSKSVIPTTPGQYWVVSKRLVKTDGTVKTFAITDCGYARWNGSEWERPEEFDLWYGEALQNKGQDEKEKSK